MARRIRVKSGMRRDLFGAELVHRRDHRTIQEEIAATNRRIQMGRKNRYDPVTEQLIADQMGRVQQQADKQSAARIAAVNRAKFIRKWWPPYPQLRLIKTRHGAVKRLVRMKVHKFKRKLTRKRSEK